MQNTTLIYLQRPGQTLMLNQYRGGNQGKWIGVGGHMEENESPWDCVVRETAEETGILLRSARFRGVVTFISDVWEGEQMFLFTSDDFEGEMGECDEGELRWIDTDKIGSMPLWEGDRIFWRLLRENAPPFLLKLTYRGDALISALMGNRELLN